MHVPAVLRPLPAALKHFPAAPQVRPSGPEARSSGPEGKAKAPKYQDDESQRHPAQKGSEAAQVMIMEQVLPCEQMTRIGIQNENIRKKTRQFVDSCYNERMSEHVTRLLLKYKAHVSNMAMKRMLSMHKN